MCNLPFGPGKKWLSSGLAGNVFGNWKVNGILTSMTGTPFSVTGGGNQTADQVAPVQILHGINTSLWFNTASFAQPTVSGAFGTSGRNILSGPSVFNLDASLFKVISFRERYSLELRGEAFSVTNTQHFANPNNSIATTGTFGYVTGTLSGDPGARTMQLGAKFSF